MLANNAIQHLPTYISVSFCFITFFTLLYFVAAIRNSKLESTRKKAPIIFILLIIWLIIQAILTVNNVYNTDLKALPPKILIFGIVPFIPLFIYLFNSSAGKLFIDSIPLKNLTILNVARVPVEIVLYWLFLENTIPELMTFEGRNFDIIAGLTAPIIFYYGFVKKKLSKRFILVWNFICLALLLNIIINGLLSAPTPLQQFVFEMPNIALVNFPLSWLPAFVVPIMVFGHLVSIRRILFHKDF